MNKNIYIQRYVTKQMRKRLNRKKRGHILLDVRYEKLEVTNSQDRRSSLETPVEKYISSRRKRALSENTFTPNGNWISSDNNEGSNQSMLATYDEVSHYSNLSNKRTQNIMKNEFYV